MKDNAEYDHVARWATHLCNVESDRWYDIITNSNLMEYMAHLRLRVSNIDV